MLTLFLELLESETLMQLCHTSTLVGSWWCMMFRGLQIQTYWPRAARARRGSPARIWRTIGKYLAFSHFFTDISYAGGVG
jgi:hypothetical protein